MPEELKPSEKLLGAPAKGMRGEIVLLAGIYDKLCEIYPDTPAAAVETPQAAPTSGRRPRKVE